MPLTLSTMCQNIAPSLTLTIDARAKEMKSQGLDVISFGAGEPDFDTPAYIRQAACEALDLGMTRYTPVAGTLALRQTIADKLRRENGLPYTPEQILVSNGAKHSLSVAMQALLNPGDEVLIPTPCWVSYPEMVRMAGGVPVFVPGRPEDNFVVGAPELAPYITARTKLLILNTPNNPNGCVWDRDTLAGIARLAVDKGFYVVSDEIYEKLIYDGEQHVSIASLGEDIYRQTIVVNGVSKTFAMTGWRIGYAAGPKEVISLMVAYQSHTTSNPNAMAQHASIAAMTQGNGEMKRMVEAFDQRRKTLVEAIGRIPGLTCQTPKGAFYVMMKVSGLYGKAYQGQPLTDSLSFAKTLLEARQVAVVPGVAFEADDYCRLSYAISLEEIQQGLARIADFAAGLQDVPA